MDKSIKTALQEATQKLVQTSDSAVLDAELLLAHCLGKNRCFLHTWPEQKLDKNQLDCFNNHIEKRLTDYPVAYLLGQKAFWTFELMVTPDVLIPRPETELLVELALEKINGVSNPKILDLGTGSGAIALALASERKDANIFATDYSEKALIIANENAKQLKVDHQIEFLQSDWYKNIKENNFDLIVSNPPYIAPDDPHLLQTIRHEPREALVADNLGMNDIEFIIQNSIGYLKDGAWLILEHGYDQSQQTQKKLNQSAYINVKSMTDINGNIRVTTAQCKL